jgi:hypothetical protein
MRSLPAAARRPLVLAGTALAALLLLAPQAAQGQLWLQTAEVVTPVEQGPLRTLVDSLTAAIERRGLEVRRSPETDGRMSVSELRNQLIDEEGIGINSANHAFINYRFSVDSGQAFEQHISALHFVFRPGPNQSDVSVLYLNVEEEPWLDSYLRNAGTRLRTNQAAFIPFYRHLGFANVARQEETQVVQIGRKTVREGFKEEKEALIRKVERLTYDSYV